MLELKGLSLFANVGIAEAYLESLGAKVVLANEIDEERAKFYQAVYPHANMICGDITNTQVRQYLL